MKGTAIKDCTKFSCTIKFYNVVVPVNMVKLKFDPQTLPIDQTVTRLRLAACAGRKCVVTAEGCLPKDAHLFVSLPVAVRSKA